MHWRNTSYQIIEFSHSKRKKRKIERFIIEYVETGKLSHKKMQFLKKRGITEKDLEKIKEKYKDIVKNNQRGNNVDILNTDILSTLNTKSNDITGDKKMSKKRKPKTILQKTKETYCLTDKKSYDLLKKMFSNSKEILTVTKNGDYNIFPSTEKGVKSYNNTMRKKIYEKDDVFLQTGKCRLMLTITTSGEKFLNDNSASYPYIKDVNQLVTYTMANRYQIYNMRVIEAQERGIAHSHIIFYLDVFKEDGKTLDKEKCNKYEKKITEAVSKKYEDITLNFKWNVPKSIISYITKNYNYNISDCIRFYEKNHCFTKSQRKAIYTIIFTSQNKINQFESSKLPKEKLDLLRKKVKKEKKEKEKKSNSKKYYYEKWLEKDITEMTEDELLNMSKAEHQAIVDVALYHMKKEMDTGIETKQSVFSFLILHNIFMKDKIQCTYILRKKSDKNEIDEEIICDNNFVIVKKYYEQRYEEILEEEKRKKRLLQEEII